MKHRITFYLTYAFIVLFGTVGVFLLLLGNKAPRESETENRMLAGFPAFSLETVKDGSFMSGMESYLSDGMPARERIVTDTAVWMKALSVLSDEQSEDDLYQELEAFGSETEDKPNAAPTVTPTEAPTKTPTAAPTEAQPTVQETDGSLPEMATATPDAEETASPDSSETAQPQATPAAAEQIPVAEGSFRQVRADGTYRTTYRFPKENIQTAIDALNAYRAVLPEDGHVFFTQIPFPDIARSLQNGGFAHWECDVEAMIAANALPGVETVSTPEVLEEHLLAGEDLYFHSDHHWKPRAACYVAQAMLKRIGINAPDYDSYSYYTYNNFYGSSYSQNPEQRDKIKPDTIDVLIPTLPVQGWTIAWDGTEKPCPFMEIRGNYRAYLGGTLGPWRRYETGVDCGRKCLVIGDSFLCCFLPYLAPYYEEIHNTDYRKDYYDAAHRTWGAAEYIREHGISDVYVILSTANSVNSVYMLQMLQRYL